MGEIHTGAKAEGHSKIQCAFILICGGSQIEANLIVTQKKFGRLSSFPGRCIC
jgi:hypothetical protein